MLIVRIKKKMSVYYYVQVLTVIITA